MIRKHSEKYDMKYIGLYTTKNYILNTQQHNKIVQ